MLCQRRFTYKLAEGPQNNWRRTVELWGTRDHCLWSRSETATMPSQAEGRFYIFKLDSILCNSLLICLFNSKKRIFSPKHESIYFWFYWMDPHEISNIYNLRYKSWSVTEWQNVIAKYISLLFWLGEYICKLRLTKVLATLEAFFLFFFS